MNNYPEQLRKISSNTRFQIVIKYSKIAVVLYLFFFFEQIYYSNYNADVHYESTNRLLNNVNLDKALDEANNAIKLNPMEPNYYRARARVMINYLPKQPKVVQKSIKDSILKDIQRAYDLNPQNLVTIRNIIPLYYFISAQNILVGASPENVDPEYKPYAEAFYEYHKYYSPEDVGLLALIAKYEKRLNMDKDYEDTVAKVKELRPDLLDWYEAFKQ